MASIGRRRVRALCGRLDYPPTHRDMLPARHPNSPRLTDNCRQGRAVDVIEVVQPADVLAATDALATRGHLLVMAREGSDGETRSIDHRGLDLRARRGGAIGSIWAA